MAMTSRQAELRTTVDTLQLSKTTSGVAWISLFQMAPANCYSRITIEFWRAKSTPSAYGLVAMAVVIIAFLGGNVCVRRGRTALP